MPSDWLKELAHISHAGIFPRLTPLTALLVFVSSSDWFIVVFMSVVIGQTKNSGLVLEGHKSKSSSK